MVGAGKHAQVTQIGVLVKDPAIPRRTWASSSRRPSSAATPARSGHGRRRLSGPASVTVVIQDHVLGADPAAHMPWTGAFDNLTTVREPFVVLGYLAGLTSLELVTAVIILPQRQTALVAKQAAEVDLLAGGRFRLGVGVGWNQVEYQALGKDFGNRGRRGEEQIALLRRLWTEPSVTFHGRYEQVAGAGISPAPHQRPIPVWIGGYSVPVYQRIGRVADGWFPLMPPGPKLDHARSVIEASARRAGRAPADIGMEGQVRYAATRTPSPQQCRHWHAAGASHVQVATTSAGLTGVDDHLAALARIAHSLALTSLTARASPSPGPQRNRSPR